MNLKAQFFIMFGVIFGLLLLSTASIFNFAKLPSKSISREFQRTCNNYQYEVFLIDKNAVLEEENFLETTLKIKNLSNFFIKEKGVEIFFIYGNRDNLSIYNGFNESINVAVNSSLNYEVGSKQTLFFESISNITINFSFQKYLSLNKEKTFYSILRFKKGDEIYYC